MILALFVCLLCVVLIFITVDKADRDDDLPFE